MYLVTDHVQIKLISYRLSLNCVSNANWKLNWHRSCREILRPCCLGQNILTTNNLKSRKSPWNQSENRTFSQHFHQHETTIIVNLLSRNKFTTNNRPVTLVTLRDGSNSQLSRRKKSIADYENDTYVCTCWGYVVSINYGRLEILELFLSLGK